MASLGLKWWEAGVFAMETGQCKKLLVLPALLAALPSPVPVWVTGEWGLLQGASERGGIHQLLSYVKQ